MLTRLGMIGLSPPGFPGTSLLRSSLGGAWMGGLGLEHLEPIRISEALEAARQTKSDFVVCIRHDGLSLLEPYLAGNATGIRKLIVCDADAQRISDDVRMLKARGIGVLIQVTCVEQAIAAEQAGADGIVVKGNECGGRVGEETSFILLQRVASEVRIPIWVRGGVGLHSAAACLVGGAAGVVLDWQLALCEESDIPEDVKSRILRMDGSETAILGQGCALRYRAFTRAGETAFTELKQLEESLALDAATDATTLHKWEEAVEARVQGAGGAPRLLAIGQDAAFAASLAKRFKTAAGICEAIQREAERGAQLAVAKTVLRPDGPLARSHGTRFPILQGPMTRVSDTADFAQAVAVGGGLPFLALALLRGPQVDALLEETKKKLGDRPWGVGILGFVPKELRDEQLAEVRKHPPPFAIIAGGRPDQALELEREGIATYLHVPSPGLLSMFLKSGARRVIFEGRECGGHVGPRSSFVLWESMIQTIVDYLAESGDRGEDYHVVFAGGIHDARSSAMVAALAAPLSERNVRVGVLLGTSYLFTKEAVTCGAIVEGFQDEALRCRQTILLESGVGHATRCADTSFGRLFEDEKRRLIREGKSKDDIREALERLNLGRLRIASKGITRGEPLETEGSRSSFVQLTDSEQRRDGMYMIGQVAALRDRVCTIEELHADVSAGGVEFLRAMFPSETATVGRTRSNGPSDIAIVGISCLLPKAGNKEQFWENILNGVRATGEVPADRWDSELYFTSDRRAKDNCYSKWGGFIDSIHFDPMRYGMPPNSIPSVEPLQLLVLEAVRHALEDAGYANRPFDREHTSVILGAGGGVGEHGLGYGFRSMALHYLTAADATTAEVHQLLARLEGRIPEWTEDSFAGLLMNVAAGRVANRFDLGGSNFTVDAACASSLAAVRLAVDELESGSSNMVIVGGADTMQSPFAYLCFSNTQALSPTGEARPFDASADGIVISEGIAVAILKRLEDAVRDGDRVYAVIKGVGSSSDGKDKGLTAPRPAGQIRALERAYKKAGFSPDTVSLIEAHGTGTVVGDQSEVVSLSRMFGEAGAGRQECALGSVKSMIGHTKCTAGVAGLIKAALALHHKVIPPTLGVSRPNPKAEFEKSPFYVNVEPKPWIKRGDDAPRRAGVSAFGFGGTNFHAVLEEYDASNGEFSAESTPGRNHWPAELFVWRGASANELIRSIDQLLGAVNGGAQPVLRDLAAAVCRQSPMSNGCTLAVVAGSLDDLVAKLQTARASLAAGAKSLFHPSGVYHSVETARAAPKTAFLFPGQGSQSVNMLRDLSLAMPGVRAVFEEADKALGTALEQPLSRFVFPLPSFNDDERAAREAALTQTRVAQPAMGAADVAMLRLLSSLGIRGTMFGGHSYGEYVALHAAGAIDFDDLIRISEVRGRLIAEAGRASPGAMAAVSADEAAVLKVLAGVDGVWAANFNAPHQTVISGTETGIDDAIRRFSQAGIAAKRIKVSCAFHSPLVESAVDAFGKALAETKFKSCKETVFSNTTAKPHATDVEAIRRQLAEHIARPVRFADQVRGMHDAGARVFIEAGPGRTLTGLVENILKGRDFTAIALGSGGRDGITSLLHGIAQAAAVGCDVNATPLFDGRVTRLLDLSKLVEQTKPAAPPRTAWVISGAKAVPINGRTDTTSKSAAVPSEANQTLVESNATSGQATGNNRSRAGKVQRPSEPPATADARTPAPAVMRPASPVNPTPVANEGVSGVLTAHQQLMAKFLDTHKRVMLGLMGGQGVAIAEHGSVPASVASTSMTPAAVAPIEQASPPAAPSVAHVLSVETIATPVEQTTKDSDRAQLAAVVSEVPLRERLVRHLVEIVADRTGYPPDMLDVDLDLEADLGIDSIKRVEILGALQDSSMAGEESLAGDMETLAKLKTLRSIADWLADRAAGTPATGAIASAETPAAIATSGDTAAAERKPKSASSSGVPRMTLQAADHPLASESTVAAIAGTIVIVSDEQGVADKVAETLRGKGIRVEVVHVARGAEVNGAIRRVDLADAATAKKWIAETRERSGCIGGIVHLLPLANAELRNSDDVARWSSPVDVEVHSLFNIVQAAEDDLRKSGGRVIAATRMGGDFGSLSGKGAAVWPGHGAVCGLVKTLAREWPEVASRVVDFSIDVGVSHVAKAVVAELLSSDRVAEVGYSGDKRIALLPQTTSLVGRPPQQSLERDSVVLITGGARGITAKAAIELAERFACTLILVGRSPLPGGDEAADTASVIDPKQIKAILLDRIQKTGDKATPAKVESAFGKLMRDRETRSNLAAMCAAGANVEYHAVDVSDTTAFSSLIDDVYRRLGRIDGVIHGAGIIEDKLIRDKTPDSFRRVFDPKVKGAMVLASKLRGDALRFLVFFSSVSGRYGNRGQCDYAAANEVLSKLAIRLNAKWPARVTSLMWGPWESSGGMVSAELAKQFAKAGIHIISRSEGKKVVVDEILLGRKDEAEVIFGGPLDVSLTKISGASGEASQIVGENQPLLKVRADVSVRHEGAIEIVRELDPQSDLYLIDHQLDGRPVMPMAMVLELFAESASLVRPQWAVSAVRDLRVLRGITFERGSQVARIQAVTQGSSRDSLRVTMRAEIGEQRHLHDTAEVELAAKLPTPPTHLPLKLVNPRPLPISVAEAYEQWLFHGPLFAGIAEIEAVGDNGVIAVLSPSTPKRCLAESPEGHWLIDPVMVDSALQLIILWSRTYLDMTPLPARLSCYHRYAGPVSGPVRCEARVRHVAGTPVIHADFRFINQDGHLVGWLEDLEGTCSKALNRLGATRVGQAVDHK